MEVPPAKTASSTPRLSEYARAFIYPDTIKRTVWPRVESKGRELGLGFDWWQSQLGTVALGYNDDGRYCATVGGVGMSIPRQVGKTYFVLATLFILCILFPGLQVVWTSHHLRTTTKTLTAARGLSRRKKIAPHIRTVRTSHGEGQVEFTNNSTIMFGARAQGFGRGFDEIDVEVFDEAQILDTKALEDMIAATNQARHLHGALLFFMGTPPRPTDPSDAFRLRRAEALSGDSEDTIWLEIGADPESDPDDRSQWPAMNPSYPLRTPTESLLRLKKNLGDADSWNREGRGVWDVSAIAHLISPQAWLARSNPQAVPSDPVVFGLDCSPNLGSAAIDACGPGADGLPVVEVVEHRRGIAWVIPWLEERIERYDVLTLGVDPSGPVGALMPELERLPIRLEKFDARQVSQACTAFISAVAEGRMWHRGDERLTSAVENAALRSNADSSRLSRKNSRIDICQFVAATNALWLHTSAVDVAGSFW